MDQPSSIKIPSIQFGPISHAIGEIFHVLEEGGDRSVTSIEEIKVSPKRKEKVYKLANGQAIIITDKKTLNRPESVDGVLCINDPKKPKWLSHKLIEAFEQRTKTKKWSEIKKEIVDSWNGNFNFKLEKRDASGYVFSKGLRPPQIGGLHSIGSHWSLYKQPATVVMPTGTGKTETMLATLVAYEPGTLLVVVPSKVLRDQTARKFATLGLLRLLGNLSPEVSNPIVGIIKKRPKSEGDLDIFTRCNVIISTMSALSEESIVELIPKIAAKVDALIVDEAHHIGAKSWLSFREQFKSGKILQFTATPYRRDGKLVDGNVIYDYPLHAAQKDGYFKKISFEPIYEIDADAADRSIAVAAIAKLKSDTEAGYDHLLMARCADITRATNIHKIYKELAADLQPLLIHSDSGDTDEGLDQLRSRKSRIVICVNMLGEGFDLPELKIAAVHDTHKSLAVLLQFTGRFTRTAGDRIGDATVIANIAEQEVSSALERLYKEDADWNQLLSEYSSEAAKAHTELIKFLNSSEQLGSDEGEETLEISHHLLRPRLSTLIYEANSFTPKKFFEGLSKNSHIHRVWLHDESNTLYFVVRTELAIQWTRSHEIKDKSWDLFVLHYDKERNLLFLCSSDKTSNHEKIAEAVGGTKLLFGDAIFRSLGNINRLIFQQVGVQKHGRRNLRYVLYTGSDVVEALSISERTGSVKSNLSGTGWENGRPITIGCSYKGRIWSREPGTIPEFVAWSEAVGKKIKDDTIETSQIIANVLIPVEVESLPDKNILNLDWPVELIRQSEDRVVLFKGEEELAMSMFDIEFVATDVTNNRIDFRIVSSSGNTWISMGLIIGGAEGFNVIRTSASPVKIKIGKIEAQIEDFFSDYPPLVRFIDLSELDGNLLIKPQNTQELVFPEERFEVWDWDGVDINKESIWKDNTQRIDSIQWKTAEHFINGGFEVVFDDDAPGEAADLVCLKEENDFIRLTLVHCKFSKGATPGERVTDVVEVCSQAIRSSKWKWKFRDLCKHILEREKKLTNGDRGSRFLAGKSSDLNKYVKVSRFKEVKAEIIIVQPGFSRSSHSSDQTVVLASAHSFLKETVAVDLDVICSA